MRKEIPYLLVLLALTLSIFAIVNQTQAQSSEPTVSLNPSQTSVTQVNQFVTLNITISNVQNLMAWDVNLTWSPQILNLTSVTEGDFMPSQGPTIFIFPALNSLGVQRGNLDGLQDIFSEDLGVNGSGTLATLQFQVISQTASTTISITSIELDGPLPPDAPPGDTNYPLITPTSDTASATVSFIAGGAPAVNAGSNQVVTQGATVTLDGSKSISSGQNPSYTWTFTDKGVPQTLTGKTATYTFNNPGFYLVTLTVEDSNGKGNSTVLITVNSLSKPVAVITVEGVKSGQTIETGQSVVFNGSSSYEPNSGVIAKYLWNMGDAIGSGTKATITYAYKEAGTYNVTLTVFDATNQNNTAMVQVNVTGASQTTPTATPNSTPTPSATATPTPAPTSTNNQGNNQKAADDSSLPPVVLAILVIVTVLAFGGSTIWLRKRV